VGCGDAWQRGGGAILGNLILIMISDEKQKEKEKWQ